MWPAASSSPSRAALAGSCPARSRIDPSRLRAPAGRCRTTTSAAPRSAGSELTSRVSASTPPADAPTAIRSQQSLWSTAPGEPFGMPLIVAPPGAVWGLVDDEVRAKAGRVEGAAHHRGGRAAEHQPEPGAAPLQRVATVDQGAQQLRIEPERVPQVEL